MRTLMILAGLSVVGLAAFAKAQPAVEKSDPAVEKLIEQLGDTEFGTREAAFKELRLAGAKALPTLRKAAEHADLQVRESVKDLIAQIDLSLLFAPKRVTLKVANKPLNDVFQELTTQTGYKIQCPLSKPAQTYSFDLVDVTFWEAIDRIGRDAGLIVSPGYQDAVVRLQEVDGHTPFVSRAGPYRFAAISFNQYKSVDLSLVRNKPTQGTHNESLSFSFSIFSEPKLPMLGMGEPRLLAAYDSERNTMLPPAEPLEPGMPGMKGRWSSRYYGNVTHTQQTQVQLVRSSEKASSVKLLRGTVPVVFLVEQKKVTVAEKVLTAKGKKQTYGTCTITIDDVEVQPTKQVQVKMTITEANHGNDYSWTNTLHQRFELYDAKGEKYSSHGSSWNSASPAAIQVTFSFGGLPNATAPGKLVFHHWTTMLQEINFEFKDLPLP